MIGPKDAVKNAASFLQDLFPDAKDVRLEEVEPLPKEWSIVFSFTTQDPGIATIMGSPRLFKDVKVDTETGRPISVKIWKL